MFREGRKSSSDVRKPQSPDPEKLHERNSGATIKTVPGFKRRPDPGRDTAAGTSFPLSKTATLTLLILASAARDAALRRSHQALAATLARAETPGFELAGERWTYRDGDFSMNGILLKPEGRGPFPAVLISHGMGGSAASFGMMKAREMVSWGFVCLAPDYTHHAGAAGRRRPGGGPPGGAPPGGAPPGDAPGAKGGAACPNADFGASAENLRRARTCLDLLAKMPEVDATRIAAYGHSMGGFVTIGLAAAEPERLRACAITGSGVSPREGYPAPAESAAGTIRTPFLLLHGADDTVVRPSQSEVLQRILEQNRVPNERVVFEGQGHPIDQTLREEVFRRIREWFVKHGVLDPN